ncbi:TPA: SAM-dependent DNA methyltransferase, partial [Streptococcus suis]
SYSSFEKTGFTTLLIEKNEKATIQIDSKGNVVVDSELRDTEIVPLNYSGGIEQFMKDEVLPYHDDAFVSESDTKIGYEISFTKYFYVPKQLDKMSDIVARIKKLEEETDGVLSGILEGLYE